MTKLNAKTPIILPLSLFANSDILAVAQKKWHNTRVFALGLSLGGAMALSAPTATKENELNGIILISLPIDLEGMLNALSTDSFSIWYLFYTLLLIRYCTLRGIDGVHSFNDYMDKVMEPKYRDEKNTSLSF